MKTLYEYIWLDHNSNFRSKTKITDNNYNNENLMDNPGLWNYDGSSTNQANGNDSEVYLRPVSLYPDPFRKNLKEKCYLVLCDICLPNNKHHNDNTRDYAVTIFNKKNIIKEQPMFGLEQEFFFTHLNSVPLGFKSEDNNISGVNGSQGPYYCGVGNGNVFGREIAERILENALFCNLNITGYNFEVAPGQCEFQLCDIGIKAADDLIMLRYIMVRTSEGFNVSINLHPKPVKGDWNGSGCHVNFSTESMRKENGLSTIMDAIKKLELKHEEHIKMYGSDNHLRLTGKHETADINTFTYGVADRSASIRIPRFTDRDKKGYLEDRRPSSNMDPYSVLTKIVDTVLN